MRHSVQQSLPVLLVAFLSTGWVAAQVAPPNLQAPNANARHVARTVSQLMEKRHVSHRRLDDEISRRALQLFLDGFDRRKMYFTQSDIDEFRKQQDLLDDQVARGDVYFAYVVYARFMKRLDQRVQLVNQLLGEEFSFTSIEMLQTDTDSLNYPRDDAEVRKRWKRFLKSNLLASRADDMSDEDARAKIRQRYITLLKRWAQTDSDELLERYLTSVTTSFDPHTTYMSASTLENFRILMRLNLEGIGAALKFGDDGITKVTKIIPGGAADKHGKLRPEDRIVSVGQDKQGVMVDVVDMKLNDVVQLIRGPAGTVVRLGVQSATNSKTHVYAITRARIELKDSAARSVILERGQARGGRPFQVGVIDLPSFYMDMEAARADGGQTEFRSTTRDVSRILKNFDSKGVDIVILDIRRNGGGSLTEAINLTGLFIDQGPVAQVQDVRDSGSRPQIYRDLASGMAWDRPLVVLTSKFSASASEILAGAIQDYRRGLVVGDEATHGKGTVQSLLDLGQLVVRVPNPPDLGALKITMQQFYRPNGDSTQKRGVLPDIVLPSLSNELGVGEADLAYALDFNRIQQAPYTPYNLVQLDLVNRLAQRSKNRVDSSEEFTEEIARINRYKRYREEKVIPLDEARYMARQEVERDAELEREERLDGQMHGRDEVFEDNFYNREVLSISVDYLQELQRVQAGNTEP